VYFTQLEAPKPALRWSTKSVGQSQWEQVCFHIIACSREWSSGANAKMIWGSTLKDNEVGPAIFIDFLPKALASGKYIPAPEPWIVGKGLESIKDGC